MDDKLFNNEPNDSVNLTRVLNPNLRLGISISEFISNSAGGFGKGIFVFFIGQNTSAKRKRHENCNQRSKRNLINTDQNKQ